MTSEIQKFKFDKFFPHTLSLTQNKPKEPKRSQINPHLDHETAVHILLEDAAYRCFDLACANLAHLSPNCATHLKSPKKDVYPGDATVDTRLKHLHIWVSTQIVQSTSMRGCRCTEITGLPNQNFQEYSPVQFVRPRSNGTKYPGSSFLVKCFTRCCRLRPAQLMKGSVPSLLRQIDTQMLPSKRCNGVVPQGIGQSIPHCPTRANLKEMNNQFQSIQEQSNDCVRHCLRETPPPKDCQSQL